jgi:hypothetical protein
VKERAAAPAYVLPSTQRRQQADLNCATQDVTAHGRGIIPYPLGRTQEPQGSDVPPPYPHAAAAASAAAATVGFQASNRAVLAAASHVNEHRARRSFAAAVATSSEEVAMAGRSTTAARGRRAAAGKAQAKGVPSYSLAALPGQFQYRKVRTCVLRTRIERSVLSFWRVVCWHLANLQQPGIHTVSGRTCATVSL